jgi:hypothetical protein
MNRNEARIRVCTSICEENIVSRWVAVGCWLRVGALHLLLGALVGCGATGKQSVPPPPPDCGPPTYTCTATNNAGIPGGPLAVVNNPTPAPDMGNLTGAGTVITDPSFGNSIARCTDANTNPSAPNVSFDTNAGGAAIVNHFNKNDTILYAQQHGTLGFPLFFDPVTMQCSRMYPNNPSYSATGGLTISGSGADFSYSNPNWLYVWDIGASAKIYRYDFSNYSASGSPTVTLVADFIADSGAGFTGTPGNCLPLNFVPNWIGHDGPSADDTSFTAAYSAGAQDTGFYVLNWKVGSGCRVYNTSTGTISGDWGPVGPVSVFNGSSSNVDSPTDEFYIHAIFANLTGAYAIIVNGSCVTGNSSCLATAGASPYFWQVATTSVGKLTGLVGGEFAFGWNNHMNRVNSPLGQYAVRPYASLAGPAAVVNTLPPGLVRGIESHPSWVNDNSADSLPFFDSLNYPLYYNTGFPSAWTNEIIGIFPDGHTLRFAHNFTTKSNPQFSTNNAIGSISQSGKFFMQSSDWLGTLGSTSGGSSCQWGYDWLANQTYPANFQYLSPQVLNGNPGAFVFQATSCAGACTSGGAEPAVWNQTVGGTTVDGTITWTNEGPPSCRGDVFVVRLD